MFDHVLKTVLVTQWDVAVENQIQTMDNEGASDTEVDDTE